MSIRFCDNRFIIETANTSYVTLLRDTVLEGTDEKLTALCMGYWGAKLSHPEEIPADYYCIDGNDSYLERPLNAQEYPAVGGKYFENECLKVKFFDGVRDVRLSYAGYSISADKNTLTVTLTDIYYPLSVDLIYTVYDGLDIIDRHAVIKNKSDKPITLENCYSASYVLPFGRDLTLTYLSSSWGHEYSVQKQPLNSSAVLLESKAGVSNATAYPYFAVDANACEHSGEVWYGTLQYCGNWQIKAGRDRNGLPQIVGGISNYNTSITLLGNDEFATPVFSGGYSEKGFGESKRQLHNYTRKTSKTPWTDKVMPVLYNAWASFEFDLDEEMLLRQAERAANLGVEMFLIDDGWFKNRNNAETGLGDWEVDPKKFPHGLQYFIEKVNNLGMMFGIWVEPEMVTADSELYKNHPDWILRYPTRQPVKKRTQYALNMGLEEVYDYCEKWLDDLLSNNNIGYLKWDMNRYLSEVNWNSVTATPDDMAYVNYAKNVYRLFSHINEKFPDVLIENCASGGLRADLSMAKYCGRINRSDNQDCIDVLRLHEGFTFTNLTKSAGGGCHLHHQNTVTLSHRKESMKRMAYTAFLGSFSVGYDLRKLSEEELSEVAEYISLYKRIRTTVQLGDMYLLRSLYDSDTPAVIYQFVSKDRQKSVVLVYNNNKGFLGWLEAVKLYGLDKDKKYKIEIVGNDTNNFDYPDTFGDTLMNFGLAFKEKCMLNDDSAYGCFAIILE